MGQVQRRESGPASMSNPAGQVTRPAYVQGNLGSTSMPSEQNGSESSASPLAPISPWVASSHAGSQVSSRMEFLGSSRRHAACYNQADETSSSPRRRTCPSIAGKTTAAPCTPATTSSASSAAPTPPATACPGPRQFRRLRARLHPARPLPGLSLAVQDLPRPHQKAGHRVMATKDLITLARAFQTLVV
jgi:hypothetical protein